MDEDVFQMYKKLLEQRIEDELGGVERRADVAIYYMHPHYSNPRFAKPQTVYLAQGYKLGTNGGVKGAEYNYSDRLWQWDWNKAHDAWDAVKAQDFVNNSAAQHEAFLKLYYGKDVVLAHIMAGYNVSSGYPYQVYGTISKA